MTDLMKGTSFYPRLLALLCLFAVLGDGRLCWGTADYLHDERPAPDSVERLEDPMSKPFEEVPEVPTLFPRLKELIKDLPPFFRDSKLNFKIRTYYFNRLNEDAWLVGLSYDFERIGSDGLSAFAKYAQGYHAIDASTGGSLPDEDEFDITVDYRFKRADLRSFWLRFRAAFFNIAKGGESRTNFRVILNYSIPAL